MKNKKNGLPRAQSRGFTLIEMMVVVFIIGLLASIVIVSVNTSRMKARDSRRKADIKELKTAIEMYANENKQYPSSNGLFIDTSSIILQDALRPYLSPLPNDPKWTSASGANYTYFNFDPNSYVLVIHWDNFDPSGACNVNVCRTGTNYPSYAYTCGVGQTAPDCGF